MFAVRDLARIVAPIMVAICLLNIPLASALQVAGYSIKNDHRGAFSLLEHGFSKISVVYKGPSQEYERIKNAYVLTSMPGHIQLLSVYLQSFGNIYKLKIGYTYPSKKFLVVVPEVEEALAELSKVALGLNPTFKNSKGWSSHSNPRVPIVDNELEVWFKQEQLASIQQFIKTAAKNLKFPASLEQMLISKLNMELATAEMEEQIKRKRQKRE